MFTFEQRKTENRRREQFSYETVTYIHTMLHLKHLEMNFIAKLDRIKAKRRSHTHTHPYFDYLLQQSLTHMLT